MGLRFYNTLSRSKEDFAPADGKIARVYSCGPTVYSRQHIGNMRAAVFVDVLKRTLRYEGYGVEDVVNITDVGHLASDEDEGEDKLEKAAREQKKDPYEIARLWEEAYIADLKSLNIILPKHLPRATGHISEQIAFIEALEKNGFVYTTSDGVYFNTRKLPDYGKLSRQRLDDKKAGARVQVDSEKRSPTDFALWKFLTKENKNHVMQWESPWGTGFPGWHIECSAMGRRYLGDTIDIHTGGIEHIPIHHENEIAQNTGSGLLTVRFWLHHEHLLIGGGKMAKSLGNVLSLDDLESHGIHPLSLRYWLLTAHYRSTVHFTWDAVEAAQQALARLYRSIGGHPMPPKPLSSADKNVHNASLRYIETFQRHVNDDLDTPGAIATMWNMVKDNAISVEERRRACLDFDRVLGLGFRERSIELDSLAQKHTASIAELPQEVQNLIRERDKAREQKNWVLADTLRDEIKKCGFHTEDTDDGPLLKKV